MKIPYLGEENSLKEAPLFFRAFTERLENQGLTKEDAVDVAYQGYRALLLYPENVQAEALALSVFPDSKEKQNALIALTKAFLAAAPAEQGALNPEQEKRLKAFSPACKELYDRRVSAHERPYDALMIIDSAQTMAQDLQKEHAINSFCAGCTIYGVSKEEYARVQQKVFKYIHTPETLKQAAELAKKLISK